MSEKTDELKNELKKLSEKVKELINYIINYLEDYIPHDSKYWTVEKSRIQELVEQVDHVLDELTN